ncbi:MAG: S8 family serine peptidase [Acidobacteriota bacterium]
MPRRFRLGSFFARPSSLSASSRAAAVLLVGALLAPIAHAQDVTTDVAVQPSAAAQIQLLTQLKNQRSPAERKLTTPLLHALDVARGARHLTQLPKLDIAPPLREADGRLLLDLVAEIDDLLLVRVEALGGEVVSSFPRWDRARVRLPQEQLLALAGEDAVRLIRGAEIPITQMLTVTEGDIAHGTATVRADFNVDGTGVKACAMSDSVDALATLQGSGDLPPTVTVLPGQSGNPGTSEGTALLEIIHDMAPGAELFFATGTGGTAQMAQNILDLADAGCRVIIDDVLYLLEGAFQDDIIALAVEDVVAQGVYYFTSAGNSGNLDADESGVWEGDFVPTALPAPLVGAATAAHDFGGGANSNAMTFDPPFLITLQWANPLGAADDDFDLFVLDDALENVIAFSTLVQDGDDLPFEAIDSGMRDDTGNRIVIAQFAGDPVFLNLNTHRGRLETGTDGQIFGHPGAEGAITIGAINVNTAVDPDGVFVGGVGVQVEFFSSDGPRRIFFNPDGTPVAPPTEGGGPSSTVRQKPDFVAGNGVSTSTPGFNPFFGTSASAPHSAGIGALYRELFPSVDPDNFTDIFRSSALDIEDPGFDNDSGNGIMMPEDSFGDTIFADGFESGDATSWSE